MTPVQIFGHTGMKLDGNSAIWANYPGERSASSLPSAIASTKLVLESAVWMV